jgi:hypothetical protein
MVEPDLMQKMWCLSVAYWISKQAHARSRAPHPPTTNTHTHALTQVCASRHPNIHREICEICIIIPERASMVRFTYIAALVRMCVLQNSDSYAVRSAATGRVSHVIQVKGTRLGVGREAENITT